MTENTPQTSVSERIEAARKALDALRTAIDGPHPANSGLDSFTLAHLSFVLDAAEPALRNLLSTAREDNAPESIAYEVIEERYGTYRTFEIACDRDALHPLGVLNMLKDAAARGLDSREDD